MAKLTIVKEGDDTLRKVCRPVTEITPKILRLLDDMLETMHKAEGVGLAAPQVGVLRRIAIVETEPGTVYELINPEIVSVQGEQTGTEGCLSSPGEYGIVTRPMTVTVRAMDRNGVVQTYTGSELLGRAFCHEIDHLDGVLFKDKASKMLQPKDLK